MTNIKAIKLAVVLVAMLSAPAFAAETPFGFQSKCFVVNPNRFQCNFPTISTKETEIQYASMQCGSTGTVAFSLKQFQVLAHSAEFQLRSRLSNANHRERESRRHS